MEESILIYIFIVILFIKIYHTILDKSIYNSKISLQVLMRNFGVKARLAQEFTGFSGNQKTFSALSDELAITKHGQYHRIYTSKDILYIREKLMGLDHDRKRPKKIPPILNFRMTKGGTGKTTIAGNVASTLSMLGYKVLMIDGDPQSSLTSLFGINWAHEDIIHIGELMHRYFNGKKTSIKQAVHPLYPGGMLDLIAADITLVNADSWLMGATNREATFKRLLNAEIEFFSNYDAIIIDSAPGTTLLTNTFMFACETIIAVVWLDGQSIEAMKVLASNIEELNRAFAAQNFHLGVHIIANGYHTSYQSCKEALQTLGTAYPNQLNDHVMPHSASFMRQINLFEEEKSGPVLEREPSSIGARAVIDLTKSLVKKYAIRINGSS